MDLDHPASLLPIALGILAALVTVYPPNGRHRHLWAGMFITLGIVTSLVTWMAVNSAQLFQKEVLMNLTGGRNYCYVWPLRNPERPFDSFSVSIRNAEGTPLFDVSGQILAATTMEETKRTGQFMKEIGKFTYAVQKEEFEQTHIKLGPGLYLVYMSQKNGAVFENIRILRAEKSLKLKMDVTWAPHDGPENVVFRFEDPDFPKDVPAERREAPAQASMPTGNSRELSPR